MHAFVCALSVKFSILTLLRRFTGPAHSLTSSLKFSSCPCFWNTLHMPSYIQRLLRQVEHEILASYAKHWLTVKREITAGLFPLSKNTCNPPSDGEAYEGIAHLLYIAKQSLPVAFFQCSRHANIRVTWVKHNAGRLCWLSRQLRKWKIASKCPLVIGIAMYEASSETTGIILQPAGAIYSIPIDAWV